MYFEIELSISCLMIAVPCSEECTSVPITKSGCEVNIKAIQEDTFLVR